MLNYILKVKKRYFLNQCFDDVIHLENEDMLPLSLIQRPTQNSVCNIVYCIISQKTLINTSARNTHGSCLTIYSFIKAVVLFNLV